MHKNWYNGDSPRNLSGFINDKTNRLIGWATMRQLRIKSHLCSNQKIQLTCRSDYSLFNEDTNSYQPGWTNEISPEEYPSSILESFKYKLNNELDTYVYIGEHETYSGNGYVYNFRGSLFDLQNNISVLKKLNWIDEKTRSIILQLTLYTPNVELSTSVTFLLEFLSTGGVYPQYHFEPIHFYGNFKFVF